MSTSANVTYYTVKDLAGKVVGEYRQNCMCKDHLREQLAVHTPPEAFTISSRWPDEDEADHYSDEINLKDFIDRRKHLKFRDLGFPCIDDRDISPKALDKVRYLALCDVRAKLNVACAAMDPKHNEGFTDPAGTARHEVLEAYKLVDGIMSGWEQEP